VTTLLEAVRYAVVLEAAFVTGLSLAVLWAYHERIRQLARPGALLLLSYIILVAIAAWSEWARLKSNTLGWYAPLKLLSLSLGLAALTRLFQRRRT